MCFIVDRPDIQHLLYHFLIDTEFIKNHFNIFYINILLYIIDIYFSFLFCFLSMTFKLQTNLVINSNL